MSISKRDQKLLLILLGLAIFLASYFGFSKIYTAKQATVQAQISELTPQLEKLRAYDQAQAQYQSEIELMDANINAQLASYPGDMRSEDLIMYVTELEDKVGISVSSISLATPELVSNFALPVRTEAGLSSYPVAAFHTGVTASCTMSYAQMKKLVNYIYASKDRTNIDNISLSFSADSGKLSASLTLSRYFIVSSDYVYDATDIPSVETGVPNPFGTQTAGATEPADQQTN